jgi:tetratricopeptide (TPR) repeat protein
VRETSSAPQQVFVAREKELAALRAKLMAALDGRGGLVLVGGEPGVGKTTLVKQLIREAEQRGALAVFGRCYEAEGTVPYSPFVEMLEQALAIMPPDIVREDMGEDASEVARLVPELRRRFPDIPEPVDLPPEQQRRYFFNALGSFISRGSARFPLLLVMDDLHWADEPTLLLIEHTAALFPELRILGVGTYRDVELEVSRPLAATLERMLRARIVERLSVKRFSRSDVATMIEALASRPPPDAVVEAIFDETEGNPFFVEEVFRHLCEEGKIFDESGDFRTNLKVDELDVPESVRLVVGRRLERLGAEAQKVLAAGAVVGRGFPFSLLEEIADIDAGRLLDIVEEAEASRVIVPEERDGDIHYAFAHELIRQTLLAGLSLLRRQRLHLSVANALERTSSDARINRPSEIAHHLLQAGAAAETSRTLDYLTRAADRAMDSAAFEEALRALDDALTIVEDGVARTELAERKGWAVRAMGHFEECLEIWANVIDSYVAIDRREKAIELLREVAYQNLWLGRFEDVLAANQRALDLADPDDPARASFIGGIGALLGVGGLKTMADERCAEAAAIADASGDDRLRGWVDWCRVVALYSNAQVKEAAIVGRRSMDLLEPIGDVWTWCDSAAWTSLGLVASGAVSEGVDLAVQGNSVASRIGHIGAQILLGRALATGRAMQTADFDENAALSRIDFELCSLINSPWIAQSYVWLGVLDQMHGRFDVGLAHLEEGIKREPLSAFTGVALGFKIVNRALAGARTDVEALLNEAAPSFFSESMTGVGPLTLAANSAQAAAIIESPEWSERVYEAVRSASDHVVTTWFDVASIQRIVGMTLANLGRYDEAESHFEAAMREIDELPNKLDAPRIRYWYAKMLASRGRGDDRARARDLLETAMQEFRDHGIVPDRDAASDLLKSL